VADKRDFDLKRLDKVIHAPIRLGVVAALSAGGDETFTELRRLVGATDGNLTIHLQVLEREGIVSMRKRFVGRRPQTTYRLTAKGKEVFKEYVECMANLVEHVARNGRPARD
jgi:DNA-binding HxlR family transcriptional regulator